MISQSNLRIHRYHWVYTVTVKGMLWNTSTIIRFTTDHFKPSSPQDIFGIEKDFIADEIT